VRRGWPVAGAAEEFGVGGVQRLVLLQGGVGQQRPQ
jgi:hypothetical protein